MSDTVEIAKRVAENPLPAATNFFWKDVLALAQAVLTLSEENEALKTLFKKCEQSMRDDFETIISERNQLTQLCEAVREARVVILNHGAMCETYSWNNSFQKCNVWLKRYGKLVEGE